MSKKVEKVFEVLKSSSQEVMGELGTGWKEDTYQKAMEVALRNQGMTYETQRILPITFSGHVIGESIPDLVIWVMDGSKKIAVVVDLKADNAIKEEHEVQVQRYIKELRKQVKSGEKVWPTGMVINFVKLPAAPR